jgi:predicted CXXCH cytochrome family protein
LRIVSRWIPILLWPLAACAQTAPAPDAACLGCHPGIAAEFKKPVVHPGGCLACHVEHRTGSGAPPPYLKARPPALCLACHQASAEKLVNAHQRQPFQTADCTECHSPHASRGAKLIYDSQHGPFEGRHCDDCHAEPVAGKIRLNGGKVKALCIGCHVKIGNEVADSKSPHAAFDCTVCHNPHASDYRPHLKEPREALCRSCHEDGGAKFEH